MKNFINIFSRIFTISYKSDVELIISDHLFNMSHTKEGDKELRTKHETIKTTQNCKNLKLESWFLHSIEYNGLENY